MKIPRDLEKKCLELAGEKPKAKRRSARPGVLLSTAPRWSVTLYPPCRVVSEANKRGHWSLGYRRARSQREAVAATWKASPMRGAWCRLDHLLPLTVTLTHIGRRMDGDNLNRAFKAIRDEVAWQIGVDDGDERVKWVYEQRTGAPGVEVTISGGKA